MVSSYANGKWCAVFLFWLFIGIFSGYGQNNKLNSEDIISEKIFENEPPLITRDWGWAVFTIAKTKEYKYKFNVNNSTTSQNKTVVFQGVIYSGILEEKSTKIKTIVWQSGVAGESQEGMDASAKQLGKLLTQTVFYDATFSPAHQHIWIVFQRGLDVVLTEIQRETNQTWKTEEAREFPLIRNPFTIKACKFISLSGKELERGLDRQNIGIHADYLEISEQECIEQGYPTLFSPFKRE